MFRRSFVLNNNKLLLQSAFINGKLVNDSLAGDAMKVTDPANGKVLGTVPNCSAGQMEEAIAGAAAAQEAWAKTYPRFRSKIISKFADLMTQRADELAELITLEAGKPFAEAKGEILVSAQNLEWYVGEAERIYGDVVPQFRGGVRPLIRKKPVGVVGCITPWNFPSSMITRTLGGALAAGCPLVLKPSELTPFSAVALAKLGQEAGVPDGVFSVVTGEAAPLGKALTSNPVVRKFCFTGSTRVGKLLMKDCVDTVKHVGMELGGNAPFIVFDDADVDAAVEGTLASKFRNAGQTCICANRIYVQEGVHDQYLEKLSKKVNEFVLGHGSRKESTMGPVISKTSADRLRALCKSTKADGGDLICGGEDVIPASLTQEEADEGRFVAPTVFANVAHGSYLPANEIFGPLVPVIKFQETHQVIKMANDTTAGLAAYYYTSDYKKMWSVAEQLDYGMCGINEGGISTPVAPFGGVKESGLGRDGGKYGIDAFLDVCYHLHGGNIQ